MINRHQFWVLHRSCQHRFHREQQKSPEIALHQVHLHMCHRTSSLFTWPWSLLDHIDLWLDVRSFCSCSCSRALTVANCHYALRHQISHMHVTLLWWECFYAEEVGHVIELLLNAHSWQRQYIQFCSVCKLWSADSAGWAGLKWPCIAWLVQRRACNNVTNLLWFLYRAIWSWILSYPVRVCASGLCVWSC